MLSFITDLQARIGEELSHEDRCIIQEFSHLTVRRFINRVSDRIGLRPMETIPMESGDVRYACFHLLHIHKSFFLFSIALQAVYRRSTTLFGSF